MDPIPISHILAAVDFSDWTSPVLHAAVDMAERYQASVTAVYAETFTVPPYFTDHEAKHIMEALGEQRVYARRYLEETVSKEIGSRVPFETRLIESHPVDGILDTAQSINAGLIVMGTHGRSGLNRLLLGPVTEKVIRETKIPVLTMRHVGADPAGSGYCLPFQRILCPVNYTDIAASSLRYAVDLAQRCGAELTVMTVIEGEATSEEALIHHKQLLTEWVPKEAGSTAVFHPIVRRGNTATAILTFAEDREMDLIVIGAQHRSLLRSTIFGTTSIRVMRHALCPVFTVIAH